MSVCLYVSMGLHVYACMRICVYVYICVCIFVYGCACALTQVYAHACVLHTVRNHSFQLTMFSLLTIVIAKLMQCCNFQTFLSTNYS